MEQQGETRAEYGEQPIHRLSTRLTASYGKGFSYPSVKRMRQFYLAFPKASAIQRALTLPTRKSLNS